MDAHNELTAGNMHEAKDGLPPKKNNTTLLSFSNVPLTSLAKCVIP